MEGGWPTLYGIVILHYYPGGSTTLCDWRMWHTITATYPARTKLGATLAASDVSARHTSLDNPRPAERTIIVKDEHTLATQAANAFN